MKIIAHRGYWENLHDANSIDSFQRAFHCGFGIETDIRDYCGNIVISHDIPDHICPRLEYLFRIYNDHCLNVPLALNIKADGLVGQLKEILKTYKITNYFFFDMSIPQMIEFSKANLNFFSRQSDIEKHPILYKEADGVWIDELFESWIDEKTIQFHLNNKKRVCIVSPELHKKDHLSSWNKYKTFSDHNELMICTDYPNNAREIFNG